MKYESTNCTRCGGSGQYSFNMVSGTRCFKCGGSGWQFTNRGAATKAFADNMLYIAIQDIPEGAKFSYIDSISGAIYKYCSATMLEDYSAIMNGNPVRMYEVMSNSGEVLFTAGEGIKVRLHPSEKQIKEIDDYQKSLTKLGKPSKSRMTKQSA